MTAIKTTHMAERDLAGKRYRGLVRESTAAQQAGWSPERQRQDIERAARELGLVAAEPTLYERVGSGEAVGAPELEAALRDAKAGQYDVLLVVHTSRFARNQGEAYRLKEAFRAAGVVIFFTSQRIVSGSFAGSLSEGISEAVDQHENATRRYWVSGGMRGRQQSGRWVGPVPLGLRKVMADRPDGSRGWDGELEPDPGTGPIIRSIFEAFAAGQGSRAIAMDLNARGIRSTTGAPWRSNSIDRILSNPAYVGHLIRYGRRRDRHYYDHVSDDGHADFGERFPALIDPILFDQVARLRASRTRPRGRLGHRTYPLSRVLRCRQCGHRMTGVSARSARYYRCSGRRNLGICDAPSIRADVAEREFATWLGSYHLPADWRGAIARTGVREARAGERDRTAVLAERLKRLRSLFSWGDIDEQEYRDQASAIKAEMGMIAMPSMPGIEAVAAVLADLGTAWSAAPPEQQAVIPSLMLKAAEVEDGQIATFVVDAGLRPLLDLCSEQPTGRANSGQQQYNVRYSA